MSTRISTKRLKVETSPIANLPELVRAVKAEAERIKLHRKENKKKGYWMQEGNLVYKM